MTKNIGLLLAFFCYTLAGAQSTNIGREYFNVSHIKLPSNPILDNSKRTYSTNSKFISLHGFSKVNSGASLDFVLDYQGITEGEYEIEKNLVEEKDSDGKVISSGYEYRIIVDYTSSASLQIINSITGENIPQEYVESNTLTSKAYGSPDGAKKYYRSNSGNIKKRYRSEQWVRIIRRIRSFINETYGYIPYEIGNENFQILGSKKHPEYQTHQKAYEALKSIFERMKYNEPIDALALRLEPIIDSFEEITKKYTNTKRKERKLRYASYYNIAKIYYYLDQPEKAIEYGQKLIDNDYNPSDGRAILNMAENLKEKFAVNQLSTRHFDIITEDLTSEEDLSLPDEEDGTKNTSSKEVSENSIAYLITATNDTIASEISSLDISKIGYTVDLQLADENGAVRTTSFNADDCKTLALGNGEIYKVIAFDEASKTGKGISKFVKTLHESNTIELFLFNEKELVLKIPSAEKGVSTLKPDFIFGLNKKLAEFAKECPNTVNRVNKSEFKNNQDGLLSFCKALSDCK